MMMGQEAMPVIRNGVVGVHTVSSSSAQRHKDCARAVDAQL